MTLLHVHTLHQQHDHELSTHAAQATAPVFAAVPPSPLPHTAEFVGPRLANPLSLVRRWGFALELLRMCVVTLLLTAIVFPLVPRVGGSTLRTTSSTVEATTGFTETVKIGEATSISESPEAVMHVRFTDRAGAPYLLQGEPLLRGTWLAYYNDGAWAARHESEEDTDRFILRPPQVGAELVRQQITIEPLDSNVLFGVWPLFRDESNGTNDLLRYDRRNQRLLRPTSHRNEQLQYSTITTGFQSRQALDIVPAFWRPGRRYLQGQLLQLPRNANTSLTTLTTLADTLVADIPRDDTIARARRLEAHFAADGDYAYTLRPTRTNLSLDPVEDFVRNTRSGHCEYYATALTLMLRRAGIPARMVVGFKGGEWNPYGEFYLVRATPRACLGRGVHRPLYPLTCRNRAPTPTPAAGYASRSHARAGAALDATLASEGVVVSMRQMADYMQVSLG